MVKLGSFFKIIFVHTKRGINVFWSELFFLYDLAPNNQLMPEGWGPLTLCLGSDSARSQVRQVSKPLFIETHCVLLKQEQINKKINARGWLCLTHSIWIWIKDSCCQWCMEVGRLESQVSCKQGREWIEGTVAGATGMGCGWGVSEARLLLRQQLKACCELKTLYLQLFEPLHVPPFYILNLVL